MFANYDVVEKATVDAGPALLQDRARYRPFFEAAERYAAEVNLIVAGSAAAKMLSGANAKPDVARALEDYMYDFYSPHGSAHARGLADRLFAVDPEGLGRYTTLLTNVPQFNWIIMVDGRRFFTVTALPVCAGVRTASLVAKVGVARPGLFGAAPLTTLGYELALIDAYRTLCAPAKLADLGASLAVEGALRTAMLQERAWVEVLDVVGGATAPKSKSKQTPKHVAVAELCDGLDEFLRGPARVVIGESALAALAQTKRHTRPQTYVTANKLEDEWAAIEKLAHRAGVKIDASIDDPRMPGDHRLRRLQICAGGEVIATAYNSGSYELIPYFKAADARYGTAFATMRFALVDWWFAALGRAPTEAARSLYVRASVAYYGLLDALLAEPEALAQIVSADAFIGRDEDAEVALKRAAAAAPRLAEEAAMDAPRFYRAYMPADP
jgi:hypothetical protein